LATRITSPDGVRRIRSIALGEPGGAGQDAADQRAPNAEAAVAAVDEDQTNESWELLENFSGSRYSTEHPDIAVDTALEHRLKSGELKVAIEIPPNFGKDLLTDKDPEISV
jgi:hypothetical protein